MGQPSICVNLLDLQEHVRLIGPRQDMPRLLAASDIFVNSSHWEGLSVVILEAMAAGLPVVATNVSDTPRIVVKGTGLIVPPREPSLLADALCSLLDNPEQLKSFGSAARTFIDHSYSPASWGNTILTMYQSVLKSS